MISDRSLEVFKRAARTLPAYRHFLEEHNFDPASVKDIADYGQIPVTSKKNYLTAHRLEDLIKKSDLDGLLLFCATSGSTGEPYYFPRTSELSEQYSYILEDYLRYSSYGSGHTLVLVGFGMGVWIGGVITQRAMEMAVERAKLPVSILPTGYNKTEIFKALRKLAPNFDQTLIVGYPPFVKEVVDEAPAEGIELDKLHIRFLFAAEAFTETFRKYLCDRAGVTNPRLDTLNIYGTADVGAMARETPLSILVRQLIIEDPMLNMDVFKQIEKTPTLAQYNPDFIEFEAPDGEILLTADGALPLIRYAVGDNGGVFGYNEINNTLRKYGVDLTAEIRKAGIEHTIKRSHPFVFVYERTDLSVTLHGINIYPEFIKEGILATSTIRDYFTERFTMSTKHDIHQNQFLQINFELQKGVEPSEKIKEEALHATHRSLVKRSSEFAEISKTRKTEKLLRIVLWPNGHPRYFAPGTKQKWVEKPV